MNNQSISKLKLFVTGLEQRLIDNINFFRKITVTFVSGLKEYKAIITHDENDLLNINFNGKTESIKIRELSNQISKYAASYDKMSLVFEERGTNILIDGDNKNVKIRYVDSVIENTSEDNDIHGEKSQIGNRNYYIKVGQADALLKEIGILTQDGKVKNDMIRKYNQIDHFVELIDGMLDELSNADSLTILDCGCGKSYLTFVLNYYLKEVKRRNCYFIGLDYSEGVIASSKRMAENLGYKNMAFYKTDIANYIPERPIDLVVSLHACDTATDQAIALGIRSKAKAIIAVPCCHREILNQYSYKPFEAILKHGVFKARMADVLTDGIRALILESEGYDVSVVEYISPLETPKNLMIRAVRTKGKNKKAEEEYRELKKLLNVNPSLERLI